MSKNTEQGYLATAGKAVSKYFYGEPIEKIKEAAKLGKWSSIEGWRKLDYGVKGWLESMTLIVFATAEEYHQAHLEAFKSMTNACKEANNYKCCGEYAKAYPDKVMMYSELSKDVKKAIFVDDAVVRYLKEGIAEIRGAEEAENFEKNIGDALRIAGKGLARIDITKGLQDDKLSPAELLRNQSLKLKSIDKNNSGQGRGGRV